MDTFHNVDYFETQLMPQVEGLNNPTIANLIREMITYARSIEIPPGESVESKPKPEEPLSIQFRAAIDENRTSITSELLSLLEDFLTYIESLESSMLQI